MAKVSEKELTDLGQDWSNDGTGLPYSGKEVQKFIKNELNKRPDQESSKVIINQELQSQLFGNGSRKVITAIEGTSEALTITSLDSTGTETSETIDIGSPNVDDRIVTITSQLTNPYINMGGQTSLQFGFSVADYQGGIIENQFATASLTLIRQGSMQPFYTTNIGNINSTTDIGLTNQSFDLTNILAENITNSARVNATLSIQYTYSYTDEEGKTITKTIRKSRTAIIEVITLTLTVPYNIGSSNNSGQMSLQYTVKGNGSKSVYLYKNGELIDSTSEITNNSYTGIFIVNVSTTANYQIVAETIVGTTKVKSSSFYFDTIGITSNTTIVIKFEDSTGTIQSADSYLNPTIQFPKFNSFKFDYFVVNPREAQVDLTINTQELDLSGTIITSQESKQQVNKEVYTYSKRIKSPNNLSITLDAGSVQRTINVIPIESNINLSTPTEGLMLNLDADGRSNAESNPGNWSYKEISTEFSKMNWQSNGWLEDDGTALVLKNGAKAIINYPLFQYINDQPVTKTGCTFEILFKCSNPTLDTNDIITCNWAGSQGRTTGLKITTNYVGVNTGAVTEYRDEDGNVTQTVEDSVGSQYAANTYYKYAFIIDPAIGENGLCLGYLDGILSFVSEIPSTFANINEVPITVDSSYADVYIKSIKYYSKALTSDECVDSYIIDQSDLNTIETLYNKNSVFMIDDLGRTYISPSKIRTLGKGVMIISPSKSQTGEPVNIQDLNKSSDKKSYYGPFRVDYFAPESDLNLGYQTVPLKGNDFNFTHTECAIRIQGTTSTKRPRKNFRLHYDKKDKDNKPAKGSFIVGGEPKDDFKYSMSQNSVAVPIACLKVDYVDSSMTHNTGGALIYNELVKSVPSMWNPAQQKEYDGSSTNSIKTRVAIEGFPIDVFAASDVVNPEYTDTLDDTNYRGLVYMGQYNFNNDKSKSGEVFGFDGSYTYNEQGEYDENGEYQPVCLEFLDNTAPLNSFQVKFSGNEIDETATFEGFANALEVRAPEKVTDFVADYGLNELATASDLRDGNPSAGKPHTPNTYKYIPSQVKNIFKFIGECAKEVAQNNEISPSDLNNYTSAQFDALNWTSSKFTTEASEHFNLSNICGWYIWTDYTIAVDQRAKNMMLYTMDGKHWLLQYYDGDTMLGERNDTFLAYDYLTDRDTWDYAVGQYAFQGHDSWLWHLIRSNFGDMLDSICQSMRASGKFSPTYFKQVLDQQIVNSWSQRQYNYSQEYKYIDPLTETGYPTDIGTNYINAAQGSRQSHRDYLIDNRFAFLDSKYRAGNYESDNFAYYGVEDMESNDVTIVSSSPYYFGWKTPNTPIRERQFANPDNRFTVQLNVVGNTTNNPASILGASKIKELYIGSGAETHGSNWRYEQSLNRIQCDPLTISGVNSVTVLSNYTNQAIYMLQLPNEVQKSVRRNQKITLEEDTTQIVFQIMSDDQSLVGSLNSGSYYIGMASNGEASWLVDQSKQLSLPNLEKLVASNLGTKAIGSLYLPDCTSLRHLDLHGSNFDGLYKMENNTRIEYLDLFDTNITRIKLADSCPIKWMKLNQPTLLFLSNYDELYYNEDSRDTLSIASTSKLEQLVVNNCPNVNWEKLVEKLIRSGSTTKWLRITGINRTDSLSWLSQFRSTGDVTWAGLDADGNEVRDVQLIGDLYLTEYTDDERVAYYQSFFPNLVIHQPEYTLIELDETVADESYYTQDSVGCVTNFDNNTGYRFSTPYQPSGHISAILKNCHRYLGKLITPGNSVTLEGNLNDPSQFGQHFQGRDSNGTMLVCQLADDNSTFFNTRDPGSSARRAANLGGKIGSGEVYVKIPGFWYKGINYTPATASSSTSLKYTCYSFQETKPSVSKETRAIHLEDLDETPVSMGYDEGIYKTNTILRYTGQVGNVISREAASTNNNIYRVNVEGYKKIMYPSSINSGCSLFIDRDGNIINTSGITSGIGEIYVDSGNWNNSGMPVVATIPKGAKYFYITVKIFYDDKSTIENCKIVLHKGSKFSSGGEMTNRNAKDWIADMEPDWVYSDPVCIAVAECTDDGLGNLYTSFNGTKPAVSSKTTGNIELTSRDDWFQYSMRQAAYERGLQLIDYEATKLIANLFIAKYGRRDSCRQLGSGTSGFTRLIGNTRSYGMQDTVVPPGITSATYSNATMNIGSSYIQVNSPSFLGIENPHGNGAEWLDRAYFANESTDHIGKMRITMPDLSTRRVKVINSIGGYPRSLYHGKYCDITNASSSSGTSTTYYTDYQLLNLGSINSTWSNTKAVIRAGYSNVASIGIFYILGNKSVNQLSLEVGSRLLFRGNIIETTDPNEFIAADEWRGEV